MINLEQVKLLETKIAKAIDYIEWLAKENAGLQKKETDLQARLETYQKRIDELEILVMRFKEDQGKIEDAILSALDRLNQFEEALEITLWDKPLGTSGTKTAAKEAPRPLAPLAPQQPADTAIPVLDDADGDGKTCFEIPSTETWKGSDSEILHDISDPLDDTLEELPLTTATSSPPKSGEQKSGELDIF
jgi:FtsZ-binding cell division protein ZapB